MLYPVDVQCPWCFEKLTLWMAPDDLGEMITDCEVCCRPWVIRVWRDPNADTLRASVEPC